MSSGGGSGPRNLVGGQAHEQSGRRQRRALAGLGRLASGFAVILTPGRLAPAAGCPAATVRTAFDRAAAFDREKQKGFAGRTGQDYASGRGNRGQQVGLVNACVQPGGRPAHQARPRPSGPRTSAPGDPIMGGPDRRPGYGQGPVRARPTVRSATLIPAPIRLSSAPATAVPMSRQDDNTADRGTRQGANQHERSAAFLSRDRPRGAHRPPGHLARRHHAGSWRRTGARRS